MKKILLAIFLLITINLYSQTRKIIPESYFNISLNGFFTNFNNYNNLIGWPGIDGISIVYDFVPRNDKTSFVLGSALGFHLSGGLFVVNRIGFSSIINDSENAKTNIKFTTGFGISAFYSVLIDTKTELIVETIFRLKNRVGWFYNYGIYLNTATPIQPLIETNSIDISFFPGILGSIGVKF